MSIIKRNFKCTGCGDDRPCFVTTNQEKGDHQLDELKCILDDTNQTSYNWEEIPTSDTMQALPECTRVEVIDKTGRAYVSMNCNFVQTSMQDEHRTLKIFIS